MFDGEIVKKIPFKKHLDLENSIHGLRQFVSDFQCSFFICLGLFNAYHH